MGNFRSLQPQRHKPLPVSPSSFTPSFTSVPPGKQADIGHVCGFRYSLAHLPIFPPEQHAAPPPQEKQQTKGIVQQKRSVLGDSQASLESITSQSTQTEQKSQRSWNFADIPLFPDPGTLALRRNTTGLPDTLKASIESLSGISMNDVCVHYHSPKPAQVQALAYTQSPNIYVAPSQERHLAHEVWHVVQQKQGRVKPLHYLKGMALNDERNLEQEADVMSKYALQRVSIEKNSQHSGCWKQFNKKPEVRQSLTQRAIQRKVGFEAELQVPSFSQSEQGKALFQESQDLPDLSTIRRFVLGGPPYDTLLGGSVKNDPFYEITTDRSKRVDRRPIIDKLIEIGSIKDLELLGDSRSNLEYRTPAYDELSEGSDGKFIEQAGKLQKHMLNTVEKAKSGQMHQLSSPAEQGYTGVPVKELQVWLGEKYPTVDPLIKHFLNTQVQDGIYLQATVGIIPTALRDLHRRALEKVEKGDLNVSKVETTVLRVVDQTVTELSNEEKFRTPPFIRNLPPQDLEALLGILHLLFMYIVADTITRTSAGTTAAIKNAVPFLVRMSLVQMQSKAAPLFLSNNKVPPDLVQFIAQRFKESKYAHIEYWTHQYTDQKITSRVPEEEFITGDYADFVTVVLGGKPLKEVKVINPGKVLPGVDMLPSDVQFSSFNQSGIPVEHRKIRRTTITNMPMEMEKIIQEIRDLNTRHLASDQKKKVLSGVLSKKE